MVPTSVVSKAGPGSVLSSTVPSGRKLAVDKAVFAEQGSLAHAVTLVGDPAFLYKFCVKAKVDEAATVHALLQTFAGAWSALDLTQTRTDLQSSSAALEYLHMGLFRFHGPAEFCKKLNFLTKAEMSQYFDPSILLKEQRGDAIICHSDAIIIKYGKDTSLKLPNPHQAQALALIHSKPPPPSLPPAQSNSAAACIGNLESLSLVTFVVDKGPFGSEV
ncbi:hypothetical protein BC830DRAFT_1172783 [Chytriomyces sp. MP71]|nr:hypothetical protein BC830DRAFT_1172783 [Chytriomyces sp. MP71]